MSVRGQRRIAIVDYGVGNLRSVEKAFEAVDAAAVVTSDPDEIRVASGIVLPGVGAFGQCAAGLVRSGLDEAVLEAVRDEKPLLGLCVGMQLLFEEGHEFGLHRGLALMKGRVIRFPEDGPRVPQIGWNQIEGLAEHPLLRGIEEGAFFYFVHSYRVDSHEPEDVLAWTEYGVRFPSICGRGRVFGVQFHPEKSQRAGLRLLANFASL